MCFTFLLVEGEVSFMVIKMQESGFCAGVRRAVENAMQYENQTSQKQVVLLGDLVHNKHVMQTFLDKGFSVLKELNSIPVNSTVVIRAHGVSCAVYNELEKKNVTIEDCTCVNVKRIHEIVAKESAKGYRIIVIGEKKHAEVRGIVGWCSPDSTIVVEKESDLVNMDFLGKVCVVAQTTCKRDLWEKAVRTIRDINPSVVVYDTLCNVTNIRESKAKAIAEQSDTMIVIGDKDSANSCGLCDNCHTVCENSFLVSSLSDLTGSIKVKKSLMHSDIIGLAGSASAPDDIISDIYNYLVFIDFLNISKKEIEAASQDYFDEFCSNTINCTFVQESLNDLRSQNEGGKRIRGAMVKLGEQIASRGVNSNYLPIAVGYELFQTSILIHDDIIDKSDIRRKKATIHCNLAKRIKDICGDNISDVNAEHYGVSRALCTGDYGFFISFQFLSKCSVDVAVLEKVYQLYFQILTITCEGEIMDTILPFEKISILDNYKEYENTVYKIYEYKTAWYTLAGPIMLGAVCGGASDELISLLESITVPLGIAFQIKDDLLGIYSSEKTLGKSVLSDIRENKQTLLLGYAYKNADDEQRLLLDQHYGKENADECDLEVVRNLFEKVGAKQYAENEIQRLSNESKRLIHNNLIDKENQAILLGLISYLTDREF